MRTFQWFVATTLMVVMAGCTATTQQPLPTVVLDSKSAPVSRTAAPLANGSVSGFVTASGIVVPSQQVKLGFTMQERVTAVNVAVGDSVKAGQMLAQLDDSALQAQIKQAQSAVTAAQSALDLLAAGPTDAQLRQANAAIAAATANYSRTVAGGRPSSVAAAQAALTAATDAYNKLKAGPLPETFAAVAAAYRNAEAAVQQAQSAYDAAYRQNPAAIGASPQALALQQATNNFVAAKSVYNLASQQPDATSLSAAYQQVQSARAALDAAANPARDFDIAQANAQIEQAQAALDGLKAGARPQQLDAAKAQVESAKAALAAMQVQLVKNMLLAPFDGVVMGRAIQPGETAQPGVTALVIADTAHLRVDTTDLSERNVPQIVIGQPVMVIVKALGQSVNGKVTTIAPGADTLGGDVVYKTSIALDTIPSGLRAGMSVEVQFGQ
jgi:HlyD family secretion protein